MNFFEQASLRLKQALGVRTDKALASELGMSPTAFVERKKRDAFPEDKLRALAQQRPDLPLDVEYVLTGKTTRDRYVQDHHQEPADYLALTRYAVKEDMARRDEALTDDERELLELFRAAPLKLKMQAVALLAGETRPGKGGKGLKVKGSGNRVAGRDYHE